MKRKVKIALVGMTILALAIIILTVKFNIIESSPDVNLHESADTVVEANNQFALDLYSKYKSEEGNIFFSPFSISSAIAMTYEGARGTTAEEIQKVFYFPEKDILRSEFTNINEEINKQDKTYELSTANALWAQKDYTFLKEYFDSVDKYYNGKATNLDFVEDPKGSCETINKWVELQTKDKIKNIISPGTLNEWTRLVLTNAVYFKGTWKNPFNKDYTKNEDFKLGSFKTVKVPMMRLFSKKFNYAETYNLQILELPYKGEELSMLIILPKNSLGSLEGSFNIDKLTEWRAKLKENEVDLYIPKFTFETEYLMVDTLTEMGMPTAFTPNKADFSGMDGTQDLFISNVIHKAFVEVNEEGTEAAAATTVTAVPVGVSKPHPKPVFKADHPFLFIIQQRETGNILFLGRVTNPL